MQQRAQPKGTPPPPTTAKKGAAPAGTAAAPAAPDTTATANDKDKAVRTVGPTFIPPKQ